MEQIEWIKQIDESTATIWGSNEFGGAVLGDERRCKRAARIASGLLCKLGSAISSQCGKGGAQAVSRFFDCERVTEKSILSGHQVRVVDRCEQQNEGRILVAQDTTELDYSERNNLKLGPTKIKNGNGIFVHTALAMNEQGLPLGILGERMWCRDKEQLGINKSRRKRNALDKESAKWLWGLDLVNKELSGLGKEVVLLGDRESDMYDLFASERADNVHILARMSQDRNVKVDDACVKIYAALEASAVIGNYEIEVPKRVLPAKLEVRSCLVLIPPPRGYKRINSRSMRAWAVELREIDAPEGAAPLHWRLLTTLDATIIEYCRYIADCYSGRWGIEEFHRILKDGCKVERMQFEKASRLRPAIAMLSVVAQQVMYLTKYARCYPDNPASSIATQEEQKTVESWVRANRYATFDLVSAPDYVRGIGFIGGFRGRKCDGEPGVKPIWEGLRDLKSLLVGRWLERRAEPVIQIGAAGTAGEEPLTPRQKKRAQATEAGLMAQVPGAVTPAPGRSKWRAVVKAASAQLDCAASEMQDYIDRRSEAWQDSQAGESLAEMLESVQDALATLEDIASQSRQAKPVET